MKQKKEIKEGLKLRDRSNRLKKKASISSKRKKRRQSHG